MTRNHGDSKALSCEAYGPADVSCISDNQVRQQLPLPRLAEEVVVARLHRKLPEPLITCRRPCRRVSTRYWCYWPGRRSCHAAVSLAAESPTSKRNGSARYQAHAQVAQLRIVGGDDLRCGLAAAAPGAVGVGDQRGVKAQRRRQPAGGVDAIVGLGAG